MTLGKSSIERAAATVNPEEIAKQPEAVKTEEKKTVKKAAKSAKKKAPSKKIVVKVKADNKETEVKAHVVTGTDKQVFATIAKDKGINAHYGVNDELPTFLL